MGSVGSNSSTETSSTETSNTAALSTFSTRLTTNERNARELARVERENRQSGLTDRQQLREGESYTFDWSRNETRQGTYIGTRLINNTVVLEFRQSNGKIVRVEDEDLRRMNFRKARS